MMLDRRSMLGKSLVAGGLVAGVESLGRAQGMMAPASANPIKAGETLPDAPEVMRLWPNGPSGRLRPISETIVERSKDPALKDRAINGIADPRIVVFRPKKPNGASVLITPGGGYIRVVIDREGYEMARWLAARGFTCFVLFYRLPGEGWASGPDTALADAQRAMRLIRQRAASDGLDPVRVTALGFSAGGHLCADLAARADHAAYQPLDAADTLSARPHSAAPIYPVVSMSLPDAHKGSREQLLGPVPTPALEAAHAPHLAQPDHPVPHFLCHAEDDPAVPIANTLLLRAALKAKGARVETHLFEVGGHGFGLRLAMGKPVEIWPELWLAWAKTTGLI